MGGAFVWEFLGCAVTPVLAFPSPSPTWPGYDLNDDAKMYMNKRWFHDSELSGLGLSFYGYLGTGHIGGALD